MVTVLRLEGGAFSLENQMILPRAVRLDFRVVLETRDLLQGGYLVLCALAGF